MKHNEAPLIYLIGIGGIAMGTMACMLRENGHRVVGSDRNLYPPMSLHLERENIPVLNGYHQGNIARTRPDLVVIGNVVRRDNPEAKYVINHGIPYLSMPAAIREYFLHKHTSIVVAGTHGKSTTTSLLAWVLEQNNLDPSAFIGAFVKDWDRSYRIGTGPYMVLEGDEYDTAFFNKGPKFLHYEPTIGVITSIEFDHADIFSDLNHVIQIFRGFVRIIPATGCLIVNADDPRCLQVAEECRGKVITYGRSPHADWRLLNLEYRLKEVHFSIASPEHAEISLISPLPGRHNVYNALAVLAAGSIVGLSSTQMKRALLSFAGIRRRQDEIGSAHGVVIIDDFAHHPTAVKETLAAVRLHYQPERVLAVFEPRTNTSRRRIFQEKYVECFDTADWVAIKEPPDIGKVPPQERLDVKQLVDSVRRRGKSAQAYTHADEVLRDLVQRCRKGDLVIFMSNGDLGGLPAALLEKLRD